MQIRGLQPVFIGGRSVCSGDKKIGIAGKRLRTDGNRRMNRHMECGDLSPLCAGDLSPSNLLRRPSDKSSAQSGDKSRALQRVTEHFTCLMVPKAVRMRLGRNLLQGGKKNRKLRKAPEKCGSAGEYCG